ncbi:MAG: hypothetical protein VW455_02890 [Nitrospinota bacterium]
MSAEITFLIECPACGIENLLADFTPGSSAICNQCRESLLCSNLVESHKGHTCDDCGMVYIMKSETDFVSGESECQCGSTEFSPFDIGPFVENLLAAEAACLAEEDEENGDFDWCRSDPDDPLEGDYNNIFDDDPGFGR